MHQTPFILQGAEHSLAPKMVCRILDTLELASTSAQRVPALYLIDSVVQTCRKPHHPGCGPDTRAGKAYPRAVAAALPRLVAALCRDDVSMEKLRKVCPYVFP